MKECPFCNPEIIKKQKIFETDSEYVIYNKSEANRGRCLVVPKRHVENIRELSDVEVESLIKTVSLVSGKLKSYLNPAGINYGFNEGKIAGQVVSHFHFHILPRFKDDKISRYHLFHGEPNSKSDLSGEKLKSLVTEFREIFGGR
jgi:histidine triad (HIT) family protein